jgi:hypothetical protein
MFADLFARMALQAHRGLRRALTETTYLIDSTGVRLTGASGWARFSAKACGAKVHVIYDADADRPIYVYRFRLARTMSDRGVGLRVSDKGDQEAASSVCLCCLIDFSLAIGRVSRKVCIGVFP